MCLLLLVSFCVARRHSRHARRESSLNSWNPIPADPQTILDEAEKQWVKSQIKNRVGKVLGDVLADWGLTEKSLRILKRIDGLADTLTEIENEIRGLENMLRPPSRGHGKSPAGGKAPAAAKPQQKAQAKPQAPAQTKAKPAAQPAAKPAQKAEEEEEEEEEKGGSKGKA